MNIRSVTAVCFVLVAAHATAQPQKITVGPWEVHQGNDGIVTFKTLTPEEKKAALDKASIPLAGDPGWTPAKTVSPKDAAAMYSEKSKLTRANQDLDFTYFQSIVTVPAGVQVTSFQINYDQVDDGARVWLFNDRFPKGTFLPEADVVGKQVKKATADMKGLVATGANRVVIAQYDFAPVLNNILGIRISVNGAEVKAPTEDEIGVTLYDGENYQGLKLPYTAGTHDIYSAQIGLNDTVSSVKVKPGWKVTLYQDFQMGGRMLVLTSDTPELKSKNFDNMTSGVKIEKLQ